VLSTTPTAAFVWAAPLPPWTLEPREIHLWWVHLDLPAAQLDGLEGLLAADERARANQFAFARDRRRFVAARAFLRRLVAAYLGEAPERVRFVYGPLGKPGLAPEHGDVCFNLAHSEGFAVCALSSGQSLGVDVEVIRPLADLEGLARNVFTPRENAALAALPEDARLRAFYTCWTRKEAFLKATGDGLARPLDTFSVSLAPEAAPRIEEVGGDLQEPACWSLFSEEPEPGLVAAVAIRGTGRVLRVQSLVDRAPA
jgi:4'-phosphopantetheinyl transferase